MYVYAHSLYVYYGYLGNCIRWVIRASEPVGAKNNFVKAILMACYNIEKLKKNINFDAPFC